MDWIVIAVLYLAGLGFFHIVGGVQAAGEALQEWGARRGAVHSRHGSSS